MPESWTLDLNCPLQNYLLVFDTKYTAQTMANCGRNTLPVARMNKEQLQVHLRNKHFPQAVLKILYDQQIDGSDFIDLEWNDINNLMSGFPFREKKAILLFIEKVKKSDTPPIADSTHLLNHDSHQTHQGPALLAIKQECSDCYITTSPGEAHTPTASTTHYQRALCESMNSNVPVTPQESPSYHATTATQEFSTPLSPCNTAQGMLLHVNETNANPQLNTSPATQNSRFGQRKRNRSRPTMWKDDFEFFHNPKLPDHLDALLKKKTTRDLPWKALLQACRSIQSYIEMKLGRKPLKPERDAIARDFIRVYPCLASLDETRPKESVLTEQIRVRWKNNEHTVKKKFERLENMKGDRRNATESKTKRRKIESVGGSPTQYAASGIVENQETSLPNCNTDVERLSLEQPVVNSIQTHHSEMCDSNSSYSYLEPSHTVYATQEHVGNNRASQPSCSQSVYETVSSSKGHQMNCRHLACQVSPRNLQLYVEQKPSDGMPVDPSESNNSKSPYASVKPLGDQAAPGHQPSANNSLFHQTFHGQPVNQTASTSWNHQKEMKTKEMFQSQPYDLQKTNVKPSSQEVLECNTGSSLTNSKMQERVDSKLILEIGKRRPRKGVIDDLFKQSSDFRLDWIHRQPASLRASGTLKRYSFYQREPEKIVEDMIYIIQRNSRQVTRDELQANWKEIEDCLITYGLSQNIDVKGIRTLAAIRVLEITFGGQRALGKIVRVVDDAGKLSVKGRKDGRLPRLSVLVHEDQVKRFVIFLEEIIFCDVESNNLVLALLSYMGVHFLCKSDYARTVKSACQFLEYFWLTTKVKSTIRGRVRQLGLAIMGNV